jgi:F420-dependent oxidoreductase-like protein
MKLGLLLGTSGASYSIDMDMIREAEGLGFDSVWSSEAYGSDAVTPAAWVLAQTTRIKVGTAIMQIPARTPATAASTAMTMQALSGGRFMLGLGPSGPQVVEGWHGMSYDKPLTRMREYIEIVRMIIAREAPVSYDGHHYQLPYKGPGATGLGKPLKSVLHAKPGLKIYTASITPAGLRMSGELANGVFPILFNPERFDLLGPFLEEGFAAAGGGKSLADFDVAPFVIVAMGDDLEACRRPVKEFLALYLGGMGARGKNFYNDCAKLLGYEDAAVKIQDLFLDGKRGEAMAAVPDQLVDEISLVGSRERIADRLGAWKDAGKRGQVGAILMRGASMDAVRALAEEVL